MPHAALIALTGFRVVDPALRREEEEQRRQREASERAKSGNQSDYAPANTPE